MSGRLGGYAAGLWRPGLRRALARLGWRLSLGPDVDAVAVWGRRPVAWRGRLAARALGKPLVTLEDGFLRSVMPGPGAPVIGLTVDDLGVHYDAAAPSRLERLIAAGDGDVAAAARGMARLRALGLSKYNHAPRLADPPSGHVLVIDQTAGDAALCGAGREVFARMLDAARTEHPGAEILIRAHPETALGRKAGHFRPENPPPGARLFSDQANPWDLIEGARAVYTVSSQLGFEALIAGRPVRCFGMPFYAGWGVTADELAAPERRGARRSVAQIFAAAYLEYPRYFDPWTGALADFDAAVDALSILRAAHERTRTPSVVAGARLWKRGHVAGFLDGAGGRTRFAPDLPAARRRAAVAGGRAVAWASAAPSDTDAWRLEDGFLRSAGLGAALTPPLSLTLDDLGAYYDPMRESRLERLITDAARRADLGRARRLRAAITRLGVTKYNLGGEAPPEAPPARRVILVVGQVEDDAALRLGARGVRRNADLLARARAEAPDAWIVYKPHPDVEAGLREGGAAGALADVVAATTDPLALIAQADEVWTMTSLMGFEALLRGKRVVCWGTPFYAGWGLTEDRGWTPARRRARPSVDALVQAALIDYPLYRDPVSGLPCAPELIVTRLAAGVAPRTPANRLLAKAQGALAGYAWLWRGRQTVITSAPSRR